MKKQCIFLTFFSSLFSLLSCYNNPIPKENTEEIKEPTQKDSPVSIEPIITESEPLIYSDEYHEGFYMRKRSSFYPYEPIIRPKLPKLNIITDNGTNEFTTRNIALSDKPNLVYEDGSATLTNCEDKYIFNNVRCKVKPRGNAGSLIKPKKGLNLKFDSKQSMLGVNNNSKFKKWVLNPINDLSGIRDFIAFYLGKQVFNSDGIFSSDCTFIDLYLNNEYWGMYLLSERNQINKNRVNIDDVEDREPLGSYSGTDIGYLFEYDGYAPIETSVSNTFKINYYNDSPLKDIYNETVLQVRDCYLHSGPDNIHNDFSITSDIYSANQKSFLQNYVGKLYTLLYCAIYKKVYYEFDESYTKLVKVNEPNITSYDVINKVINIQSFVDMHILQEIFKNPDLYWGSQYFYVDMSKNGKKKLSWSGVWDNDLSFGFKKAAPYITPTGRYVGVKNPLNNAWYFLLIHEDWFWDMVREKWVDLVKNQVFYNSLHYIDEISLNFKDDFAKNQVRWGVTTSQLDESNFLFTWLTKRYNSLNMYFGDKKKLFNI